RVGFRIAPAALWSCRGNCAVSGAAREGHKKGHSPVSRANPDLRKRLNANGSSGWTRTNNPPVNRLMQVVYPVGSSMAYLNPRSWFSTVFGSKLFTDCSRSESLVDRAWTRRPFVENTLRDSLR